MSEAKKKKERNNKNKVLDQQLLENIISAANVSYPMPEMSAKPHPLFWQPLWHMHSSRLCPALSAHLEVGNNGSQVVPSKMPPIDFR